MRKTNMRKIVSLSVMLLVFSLATLATLSAQTPIFPGMWTCSGPSTDMMSCLECASQAFDNCIAWCEEVHQNFQGSYCRQDCLDEYNGSRFDCNDNFDPLVN